MRYKDFPYSDMPFIMAQSIMTGCNNLQDSLHFRKCHLFSTTRDVEHVADKNTSGQLFCRPYILASPFDLWSF